MKEEFEDYYNDSICKFESMLKTNSFMFFDSDEFEEIIVYYIETGNMSLAKKAIAMATEQYPNSTALALLNIEVLIFDNELKEAEKIIFEISAIDPINTDILIQKAKILSKKKNHFEAIDLLIKIDSNSDLYFEALSIIGKEYLFLDDFINAKKYFIKYLNHNKFDYGVLNNVLYCFECIGDTSCTINYLNSFLEKNPYSEIAWHQLGKQYAKDELYEEALKLNIELVALEDPRDFADAYQEDLDEGIIGVPGTIAMMAVDLKYLNAAGRAGVSGESFVSQISRDMRLGKYEHVKALSPTSTLRTVLPGEARKNQEFVLFGPNAYCTPLSKGYGPRGDDDRPIGAKVIGHSIDITAGFVTPVNLGQGYNKAPMFPFDRR